METAQRCKHVHMPRKERKRKRGIETAAHNCVKIDALYVITHITGFRLDRSWNRTTMGDNAGYDYSAYSNYCYGLCEFYCVSGKTGD